MSDTIPAKTTGDPVLLPVFSNEISRNAITSAIALAEYRRAKLVIVGMESVPEQTSLSHPTPAGKSQQRSRSCSEQAREIASSSLEITDATRVGHSVAHIIFQEVKARGAQDLVLEQTAQASASQSLFGDSLSSVFASADCNVVLITGTEHLDGINSILVGVAGGPHSGLAVDVAMALAVENDAWLELYHVLDPEASVEERKRGTDYVNASMARLEEFERADTWIHEASNPAEAIIEQAQYYDLTILGSPQKGRLRRFVFGSTTDTVSERSESSLITVRSREGQQNWYEHWLGRGT